MEHQHNLRDAFKATTRLVAGYAASNDMEWPFVTIPLWETYAHDARVQAQTELVALWPRVAPNQVDAFTNYTTQHYEAVIKEGHMIDKGNLDRLIDNHAAYKPYISRKTPDGEYPPDVARDVYYPQNAHFSPPPISYGIVNWNMASVPPLEATCHATYDLQYETLLSIVMPYQSADLIFTREEHAAMHSKLKDSTPEHPHLFAYHPVHKDPNDDQSKVVALMSGAVALDVALLDLLPDNVEGIHCVITNNMNQTFTYEINGHDAIFLGPSDFHEPKYDDFEVLVNLTPGTHPNFTTTRGNTVYEMASRSSGQYLVNEVSTFRFSNPFYPSLCLLSI